MRTHVRIPRSELQRSIVGPTLVHAERPMLTGTVDELRRQSKINQVDPFLQGTNTAMLAAFLLVFLCPISHRLSFYLKCRPFATDLHIDLLEIFAHILGRNVIEERFAAIVILLPLALFLAIFQILIVAIVPVDDILQRS